MSEANPLIDERTIAFLLYDVLDAESLCRLPHFADHSRETFELYLGACARFARKELLPSYKDMDEQAPHFDGKRVHTHPAMAELYPKMVELGLVSAARDFDVEGQQLPLTIASAASAFAMAGNLSAFAYCMLTTGAAHLVESFGSDELRQRFMQPMYAGRFTGTMALTEPEAGSSLGDLRTRARPTDAGHYLIDGAKVFISGADNSFSENIVHLTLARIEGAPAGSRGISLFAVPRLRQETGDDGESRWVDNDVQAAGAFHKLGWRGIPSIALNYGERGDCHGYLVGQAHRGLACMFQMMNEARINIGLHAVATASVAYHESLHYAQTRVQGRLPGMSASDAAVPIIAHPDVRRMLLRQKAVIEGGLSLVLRTAWYQDLSRHAGDAAQRDHAAQLLDLLTPIAKTFPSERGFECNTLAVQIHGGYGYTSEYLPEAWLRDQKLNSIHEGTTGIQSMDLLGRKVLRAGGASIGALVREIEASCRAASALPGSAVLAEQLSDATARLARVGDRLLAQAQTDPLAATSHSVDYLELASLVVVAWQWLDMHRAAERALADAGKAETAAFHRGKRQAALYWFRTELPRVPALAELCESAEDSYSTMQAEWF